VSDWQAVAFYFAFCVVTLLFGRLVTCGIMRLNVVIQLSLILCAISLFKLKSVVMKSPSQNAVRQFPSCATPLSMIAKEIFGSPGLAGCGNQLSE
jgi:hypothetical protein